MCVAANCMPKQDSGKVLTTVVGGELFRPGPQLQPRLGPQGSGLIRPRSGLRGWRQWRASDDPVEAALHVACLCLGSARALVDDSQLQERVEAAEVERHSVTAVNW